MANSIIQRAVGIVAAIVITPMLILVLTPYLIVWAVQDWQGKASAPPNPFREEWEKWESTRRNVRIHTNANGL